MLLRNINLFILLLISTIGFGQRVSGIRKPLAPYTGYYRDTVLSIKPTHILSYYPMNESSGTVCTDVKNGRNGTYANGTALGKNGIGDGLTSVQVDGTNDYIDIGNATNSTLFDGKEGTLSFWVKVDTSRVHPTSTGYLLNLVSNTAGNQIIILKDPSDLFINTLYIANGRSLLYKYPVSSEWMHICIIWDYLNSQFRVYYNGELPYHYTVYPNDILQWSGTLNTDKMNLGVVDHSLSTPIKAQFAHFAYWDTTLTAGEIRQLSSLHRHDNTVHPDFETVSMKTLFRGDVYNSYGDHYARPNILDYFGYWMMIYKRSPYHNIQDTIGMTHIRFSADEGVTWSKEDTLEDGVTPVDGLPTAYHAGNSNQGGGILFTCPGTSDIILHNFETGSANGGTYQYRSTDAGITWVDEGRVVNDYYMIGEEDYTIVGDSIFVIFRDITNPVLERTRCLLSTDNAVTWSIHSTVSPITIDANESGIEWVGGDTLVVVARGSVPADTNTYQYNSYDRGLTWSAPIIRNNPLGLFQKPTLKMFGDNLFLFGRDNAYTNAYFTAVSISRDRGATWSELYRVDPWDYQDAAYCDIFEFAGGYYLVSYRGIPTQTDIFRTIFILK